MPEKQTLDRARRDGRQGKAPSTPAGEFIRQETDVREQLLKVLSEFVLDIGGRSGIRR
jgi:hypothetical protein